MPAPIDTFHACRTSQEKLHDRFRRNGPRALELISFAWNSEIVMAGLDPATPLRLAPCSPKRDARDKRGHDDGEFFRPNGIRSSTQFFW
jgi:hypothetical protein